MQDNELFWNDLVCLCTFQLQNRPWIYIFLNCMAHMTFLNQNCIFFSSTLVKASPPSETSAGLAFFTHCLSRLSHSRILDFKTPWVPCPCKTKTTAFLFIITLLNLSSHLRLASSKLHPVQDTYEIWDLTKGLFLHKTNCSRSFFLSSIRSTLNTPSNLLTLLVLYIYSSTLFV